jgi:hypothetical protein
MALCVLPQLRYGPPSLLRVLTSTMSRGSFARSASLQQLVRLLLLGDERLQ